MKSLALTTRAATAEDRAFVRETHHAAFHDVSLRQFGTWDLAKQDEYFEAAWQAGGLDILLIDGIRCGYSQVERRDEDFHVREIVLAPAFQGRGIGTKFLRDLQATAKLNGLAVRLGTMHFNRAISLYKRLGFREYGRTTTHLLMEWRA